MTLVKFKSKSGLGYHPALPTVDEIMSHSEKIWLDHFLEIATVSTVNFVVLFWLQTETKRSDPNQNLDPFQPFFSHQWR